MVKKLFLAICLASFVAQVSAGDTSSAGGAPADINLNYWEYYQGRYAQLLKERDAARAEATVARAERDQALLERTLAIEAIGRIETAEALRGARP